MIKYFYLLILITTIYCNQFLPENNSELNYRQIKFSWPQIPNSNNYQITINDINDEFSTIINTQDNIYIYTGYDLSWSNNYQWQACGLFENNLIECHEEKFFSTKELPQNPLATPDILINELDNNNNNIIIYNGNGNGRGSVAIDKNGFVLWFLSGITVHHLINSGNFTYTGNSKGIEVNKKGEIIFETPVYDNEGNFLEVHHSFKKTKNNTYITHIKEYQAAPCPSSCPEIVYTLYPDGNIIWKGDIILEFDNEGNIIWEWNLFDEIGTNNYNEHYIQNLGPSNNFTVDWTHSNEVFFNEDMTSLYTSIRNLSTINKINYETKEIIWSLGDLDTNYYFNESPTFSQQHTPIILENGNLMIFNNGTFNEPELSSCQEYEINEVNNSFNLIWEYILPDSMYTRSRGECHRLNNGNTLIATGKTGYFLEINNNDEIVYFVNSNLNNVNRISKVRNLYPTSFNIHFDNYSGTLDQPFIDISSTEEISFDIINNGWAEDIYNIHIYNDNINYSDIINAEPNSVVNHSVSLNSLINDYENNSIHEIDLNFHIISSNNPNIEYLYNFKLIIDEIQIYDLNQDLIVDILDITQLINCIFNQCENNYDTNNDGVLNIVDIIGIINYIFENI